MARSRPTAVTVLGIMNIVLGSLLLLCYLCGAASNLMQAASANNPRLGGADDPGVIIEREIAAEVPAYRAYQVGNAVLGLILSTLLLVSGIGLLNMQGWARIGSIIYAVVTIPESIGSVVFQLLVLSPAMSRAFEKVPMGPAGGPGVSVLMTVVNVVTIIVGMLLIVYALILLITMLRAPVREAFTGRPATDAYEPRPMPPDTFGAERPPPGGEGPPAEGGGEQGIRRNPWDY
jgi:hypothetical protein